MSTIELSNGSLSLIIDPSLGACVKAFHWHSNNTVVDIFRDASQVSDVNESSCFIMAPFASRVQDGRFNWRHHDIQMPPNFLPQLHTLHGQAWQNQWHVVEKTPLLATLAFNYGEGDWPWNYCVRLCYELIDKNLHMTLAITNLDDKPMPAGLGFHPFFSIDDNTRLTVNAKTMWQVDDEILPIGIQHAPTGINDKGGVLASDLVIDNVLINDLVPVDGVSEICWLSKGIKADIASEGCDYTVLYRPDGAKFMCVEPISHCINALNLPDEDAIKHGVVELQSGEAHQITMTIALSAVN